MKIHCTKKLAKKLPDLSEGEAPVESGFWDWHANLFTIHRRHCVIACHDQSRFSVLLGGLTKPGFVGLGEQIRAGCKAALEAVGVDPSLIATLDQPQMTIHYDTVCSRSVQGSLRINDELLRYIASDVDDVESLDEVLTSLELSRASVRVKQGSGPSKTMMFPVAAMQQALLAESGLSEAELHSTRELNARVDRLLRPNRDDGSEFNLADDAEPIDFDNVISLADRGTPGHATQLQPSPIAADSGPLQQLLIRTELRHVSPVVWRDMLIPSDWPLSRVHLALQAAIGWMGGHLYAFRKGQQSFMEPDPEFPNHSLDVRRVAIGQLFADPEEAVMYEYDFGDGWEHQLTLLESSPLSKHKGLCTVASGYMACPPEDVGGPVGYANFTEAMLNVNHPSHEQCRNWYGDRPFDPVYFSVEHANQRLSNEVNDGQ